MRIEAAGLAEWICPELATDDAKAPARNNGWLYVAAIAASLIAAFVIWDASAQTPVIGRQNINQARSW